MKEACDAIGIIDEGVREHFTEHCLRATCIIFFFQAGHGKELV